MRTTILLCLLLVPVGGALAAEKSFSKARAALLKGLRSNDATARATAVYEIDGFDSAEAARVLVRAVLARDDRARVIRVILFLLARAHSLQHPLSRCSPPLLLVLQHAFLRELSRALSLEPFFLPLARPCRLLRLPLNPRPFLLLFPLRSAHTLPTCFLLPRQPRDLFLRLPLRLHLLPPHVLLPLPLRLSRPFLRQ